MKIYASVCSWYKWKRWIYLLLCSSPVFSIYFYCHWAFSLLYYGCCTFLKPWSSARNSIFISCVHAGEVQYTIWGATLLYSAISGRKLHMVNEIRGIRTSFLIIANRNRPHYFANNSMHECKMSVHINRTHLFNNMSLKICHCFIQKQSIDVSAKNKVLFVNVAHVEPEHEM